MSDLTTYPERLDRDELEMHRPISPPLLSDRNQTAPAIGIMPETDPSSLPQATAPNERVSSARSRPSFARRVKSWLLRGIDLSALGFLEPIVRLCYREDPRLQLRKIGRFIVLPSFAFIIFMGVWAVGAPLLTTKYGALPTPAEVWRGWTSIMTFHDREVAKAEAYVLTGAERQALLAEAEARAGELEAAAAATSAALEQIRADSRARLEQELSPLIASLAEHRQRFTDERSQRQDQLKTRADTLHNDADRRAYLDELAAFNRWEESQDAIKNRLEAQGKTLRDRKDPAVTAALLAQTAAAEELFFNKNLIEYAGARSREVKLQELAAELEGDRAAFLTATGPTAYKLSRSITKNTAKIASLEVSSYARPWTLPMQIVRSILTVFTGFLIGVALAIPIGILCGLSSTFMAMLTPFIALFKPVSPIVWLLIFWIVVGGIFPDPGASPIIGFFNGIANALVAVTPYASGIIDDIDINPAFIASALTVSMCCLWATMVNTALGVASVDKDHLNVARVLRLNMFDRLRKIILPSALPLMFAGMRISLGIGWMVLIAAELLASSEGLGKFTNDMFQNGNTDSFAKIMVMVFVVGIIGLILDRIMIVFQRLVSFEGSVAAI